MPYVTVIFDPKKIEQEVVDRIKSTLPMFVSIALSSNCVRFDPKSTEDINTSSEEIMVVQHATHPTDVNVLPLNIYIEAGRPKGRSSDKIADLIGMSLSLCDFIPLKYTSEGKVGVFVVFHEHNGFWLLPKHCN